MLLKVADLYEVDGQLAVVGRAETQTGSDNSLRQFIALRNQKIEALPAVIRNGTFEIIDTHGALECEGQRRITAIGTNDLQLQ